MTDVFEHNPDDHDDPSTGLTWYVGGIGALLMVAILLALTALYYNVKAEEIQDQFVKPGRLEVMDLHARQEQRLHVPGEWVTREEAGETVRAYVIPIERAMELIAAEHP